MKKAVYIASLLLVHLNLSSQVGIGNTAPNGVLDTTNANNYPVVVPSATEASSVVNPTGATVLEGSVYYDTTDKCLKVFNGQDFACVGCDNEVYEMSALCDETTFEGVYVEGNAFDANNKITFKVKNTSSTSIGPLDFDNAVSIASSTGTYTIASVADYSATTLNAGATLSFTYQLSGTPSSTGDINVQFFLANVLCNEVITVSNGGAVFEQDLVKLFYSGYPSWENTWNDIDGVTIELPYTDGVGSYEAFSTTFTTQAGNNGDVNDITLSFPAGTFSSSGSITATLSVGGSDTEYQLKLKPEEERETFANTTVLINNSQVTKVNLDVLGVIIDRRFGDGIHDFIYLSVEAADGSVWLTNNLGADYTNINHPDFDVEKQATALGDHNAYGSLFQWGRYSDDHELIDHTDSTTATPVKGTTTDLSTSDNPENSLFITTSATPNDWRDPQNNNLWQGVSGINNPCPRNYRIPTNSDWNSFEAAEGILAASNPATAMLESSLALPAAGERTPDGSFSRLSSAGYYWTSNVSDSDTRANAITFFGSFVFGFGTNTFNASRAQGYSVRCIKNQ